MKRLLRIFELSNNEQRVVLIVVLTLVAIAFIGYERRVRHPPAPPASPTQLKSSPNGAKIENQQ
jgi:hypothetical protein